MPGAPVDVLQRVPLFAEVSKRDLGRIALLFKERRFAAGETVVKEGSGGATFYIVDSGEAVVSAVGKERLRLSPGDYFGEIALFDEGARAATIVAITDLVCWGLTLWEFRPLFDESASIRWQLLRGLVTHFRAAQTT
jgi:CRP/FNR family transcriptional regulator, cyclic AMP receptor protein